MADFRPISLGTVSYKIISKILGMRFKECLGLIISESQAAFVPGRNIQDNILVAHELIHALKSKKDCVESYMAIKTDISKAYDRVEWNFLESVMEKLGFATTWINWIMVCVRSVSYSFLINGSSYGEIKPSRGIRQGQHSLIIHKLQRFYKIMKIFQDRRDNGRRKISWVAWKRLSLPKNEGGLGFRDIHKFNLALLAKQAWKILQNPESLLAKIYKGQYHKSSTFLESMSGGQPSYGWKSIQVGKELLKKDLRIHIWNGQTTNIWQDKWLPTIPQRKVGDGNLISNMKICDLWRQGVHEWDEDKLATMFNEEDAELAQQIYLSRNATVDRFITAGKRSLEIEDSAKNTTFFVERNLRSVANN